MKVTECERRSTASPKQAHTMNSFIAIAGPTAPAPIDASRTIKNDGWFCEIDLHELREAMRLDGTVSHERLRLAIVDAIASVNDELQEWQGVQRAAGYIDLASVTAALIDGVSSHVLRYRRAVYNLVRADLTEQYRSYDATKSGSQHAEELDATISESRRNVRWALNDIRGIARSTVELI
jgi:hypothetical protein